MSSNPSPNDEVDDGGRVQTREEAVRRLLDLCAS
jgi:hypothetical protein